MFTCRYSHSSYSSLFWLCTCHTSCCAVTHALCDAPRVSCLCMCMCVLPSVFLPCARTSSPPDVQSASAADVSIPGRAHVYTNTTMCTPHAAAQQERRTGTLTTTAAGHGRTRATSTVASAPAPASNNPMRSSRVVHIPMSMTRSRVQLSELDEPTSMHIAAEGNTCTCTDAYTSASPHTQATPLLKFSSTDMPMSTSSLCH